MTDHRSTLATSAQRSLAARGDSIAPEMLSLLTLDETQIDWIVSNASGGVSNIQDIYPLTAAQEGMLFQHLQNDSSGVYTRLSLFELQSRQHVNALIAALERVIDRHDILRSAVLWERLPQPVQVVYRQAHLPVQTTAPCDTLQRAQELLAEAPQSWDLRRAPLMRLRLTDQSASETCYAILELHHIIFDRLSLKKLFAEVVAFLAERGHILPTPSPYREHVVRALELSRIPGTDTFFRTKLGDVSAAAAPFSVLKVAADGEQMRAARCELTASLARRLRAQAKTLEVGPSRLFHAACSLVVAHTSGQSDVVFGTVIATRQSKIASSQWLLGPRINTLPLRLRLGGISTRELLEQTRRELAELLNHAQAPLVTAQRCSNVGASAPLFTALLNYRHGAPQSEAELSQVPGLKFLGYAEARTNYPLTISVDDLGDAFELTTLTDAAVNPTRINDYLLTALRSLVDALETAADTPALALQIVPDSELLELVEFNANRTDYPRNTLVHELFEKQVARTPDAVALTHESQSLTYATLNHRANQLARHLTEQGIRRGHLVGICATRSLEMIVGVLGILKAGAAYVPLDPSYPSERLEFMLADANPRIVLAQRSTAQLLGSRAGIISLDMQLSQLDAYNVANPTSHDLGHASQELIYVIYTSGSTGRPKGVAMPHQAMVNLIEWHRQHLTAEPGQRVLQFAALSFDVAFQEIFTTLCTGGTLVLLDEWVRRDARALVSLLEKQRIERLFAPPLLLQSLAHFLRSRPHSLLLKDVITAGEQLRITPEIATLFESLPGARLHNHYGPTETHVVTALTLSNDSSEWPALPSIGRPLANTQIHVLNDRRQPVPIGVAGELFVGGANVCRGYLHRGELTAERFIADPYSEDPRARLYKTGDLARWRDDGTLEYLGRNDDQVKLRGFRIELGDIEAHLSRCAAVKETAVVAREDAGGEKRLVAYVVCEGDSAAVVEEARAWLRGLLPEFMIPSVFVTLAQMPLTPTGKLDRRALPTPDFSIRAAQQYEAPLGEVEEILAEVWQQSLRIQRVGRNDHFFELGGHSLTAMTTVVAITDRFAIQLGVNEIFKHPTVQRLGNFIERNFPDWHMPRTPVLEQTLGFDAEIRPRPADVRIPLTAAQNLVWDLYPATGSRGESRFGQRLCHIATRVSGALDIENLRACLDQMVVRHESLRTRIVTVDGTPSQQVDSTARCPLQIVELPHGSANDAESDFRSLAEALVTEEFDLAVGPPFKARLFQFSKQDHALVLALDHLMADGISTKILSREIWTLYDQMSQNLPPSLPVVPVQPADYAVWQQRTRESWWKKHGPYWKQHLTGARRIQLTHDVDPGRKSPPTSTLRLAFGAPLTEDLRKLARREQTPVSLVVLGIYSAIMASWHEQQDLLISFVSSGRHRAELTNMVGNLAFHLHLRIALARHEPFIDLLKRVNLEYFSAYEHQDFGWVPGFIPECRDSFRNISLYFNWLAQWPQEPGDIPHQPGGLMTRDLPVKTKWSVPFRPVFAETETEISMAVKYQPSRISPDCVEWFARNVLAAAEQVTQDPLVETASLATAKS